MASYMQELFEINLRNILNSKLVKFGSMSFLCYSLYEISYEILFILKDIHDENLSERLSMLCIWTDVFLGISPLFLNGKHLNKISRLIKFRNTPYKKNHRKITWVKRRNSYYSLFLIGAIGICATTFFPWHRKDDRGYMHLLKNFPGKIFEWLPYSYYLSWVFYVVAAFLAGFFMVCYTYLLIYFETVISSEVIILNENLRDISRGYEYLDIVTMPKNPWYQKMIKKRLKRCVVRHSKILRFFSEINKFYHFWLPIYIINCVLLCIFLFYYISKDITAQIETKITLILCIVLAGCIDAIYGQHIMDRVISVETALYQTPWYCWNTTNRKVMYMFLLNAQKRTTLNAVGVLDVNYSLLIWVFKSVYSCIMLLRQLKV